MAVNFNSLTGFMRHRLRVCVRVNEKQREREREIRCVVDKAQHH